MVQQKQIQPVSMRMWVQSGVSGSVIQPGHKLWCSLQMWLRSHIAVAVVQASSSSSNLIPSLRTYTYHEYMPKNNEFEEPLPLKKKKKKKKKTIYIIYIKKKKNQQIKKKKVQKRDKEKTEKIKRGYQQKRRLLKRKWKL